MKRYFVYAIIVGLLGNTLLDSATGLISSRSNTINATLTKIGG
jgi:hypothetical protein